MAGQMRADCLNVFKAFLGKRVNVHFKDGSVLVNVVFVAVRGRREAFFSDGSVVRLAEVAYFDELSPLLLEVS